MGLTPGSLPKIRSVRCPLLADACASLESRPVERSRSRADRRDAMNAMKRCLCSVGTVLVITGAAWADDLEPTPPLQALVSTQLRSQTTVNNQQLDLTGRLNLHLVATEEELADNVMRVAGLNLAYLGVPMEPFTGIPPTRLGEDGNGVLSAALPAVQRLQVFREVIPGWALLFGQWDGSVELSQLGALQQIPVGAGDEKGAVFTAPTQKASTLR